MILNDFLYTRSLNKNEQFNYRKSFLSLVPQTTFNYDPNNILQTEEYQEKIKKIYIGGRSRAERKLEDANEELEETIEKLTEEKEKLEEEKETLEQENDDLEWDKDRDNDEIQAEKNSLEDKNKKLTEENSSLKECCEKNKEEEDNAEEGDIIINEEEQTGGSNDNGVIEHEFNNRSIQFDNITKGGGVSKDKNIKNVVVSFF